MQEINIAIRGTTCTHCPTPHPAVEILFGHEHVLMPAGEATKLADELYEAALKASNEQ